MLSGGLRRVQRLDKLASSKDARAIAGLLLLWLLFFWRLFTPIAADQASLRQGDFSDQFVAFAAYQYQRMSEGEIPLWNPYNNGGLPFIADTQAAVFYPPRWVTVGLSALGGGWSYNALQLEMAAHVLLYSLLMYGFLRRLTWGHELSPIAAFIAAIVIGYGGYVSAYPPLQLAVLEAALWLPLVALGILEATRGPRLQLRALALAGFGLGLSWLAGHPQTSWFLSYVALAYLLWRCHGLRLGWRHSVASALVLAGTTLGITAVTLLPGLEYLLLTTREGMEYAAKGNGFPLKDLLQLALPGAFSQWSPLHVGLPTLFLVALAALRGSRESRFWLLVAAIGLLHSLGENSALYSLSYNFVPGLRFFRGQERAAVVVANSLAILAGLGCITAAALVNQRYRERLLRAWGVFALALMGLATVFLLAWLQDAGAWSAPLDIAVRSALIAGAAWWILRRFLRAPRQSAWQLALAGLLVFELFTVHMDHPAVYDSVPASEQLSLEPPPLVQEVLRAERGGQPFRVDGFRGLGGNLGSVYRLMDMRGISPLWLDGPSRLVHANYVDNPLAWELFAVKYVFSAKERLSIPTERVGSGRDREGEIFLHRLLDPRPFAHLVTRADIIAGDEWARQLMADPRHNERDSIILGEPVPLPLPAEAGAGSVSVWRFAPEEILLSVETESNALLSLALAHHPGWGAELNGAPVPLLRAYAGLSAVAIPAGTHELKLRFAPASYRLGATLSAGTWLCLLLLALQAVWRRRR